MSVRKLFADETKQQETDSFSACGMNKEEIESSTETSSSHVFQNLIPSDNFKKYKVKTKPDTSNKINKMVVFGLTFVLYL